MNYGELKEDEYYVGEWDGRRVIFIHSKHKETPGINSNDVFKFTEKWCSGGNINFRTPTLEEKHWLDVCIKENKIISYEKAMESFNKKMSIQEIQEECKRRFPIGCTFKNPCNNQNYTIEENDIDTYKIIENQYIDGGESKGYLYYKDKYAELIETPEVIVPEYVEYIDTKYKGKIVKIEDWKCGSYCKVLFADGKKEQPFKHLVKPSTKEAYEAQNFKIKSEDTEIKVGDYIQYLNKEFYTVESNNPVYLFHHSDNTSKVYCEDLKYLNSLKYFKKVNKNIITENFKQDIGLKPSNFNIEVGDEVELISCEKSYYINNYLGQKAIIIKLNSTNTGNKDKNTHWVQVKDNEVQEHWKITDIKLIKKANKNTTTTLNKKVDVSSPKVTDKITVPRINTTSYDTLVHINIETNTKSIKIPKLETNTPEIKKIKIQSLTLTI